MKKNKMMRVASGLLVLTLLTSCIISGTFAKYTTEATGSDTAVVAKWGVTVKADGGLFGTIYQIGDKTNTVTTEGSTESTTTADASNNKPVATETTNEFSVKATGTSDVVAPGTQSSDTGLTLSVSGSPEVSNVVSLSRVKKNGDPVSVTDLSDEEKNKITNSSDYAELSDEEKANRIEDAKTAKANSSAFSDIYLRSGSYATLVEADVTEQNFEANKYYYISSTSDNTTTYTKAFTYADNKASDKKWYKVQDSVTLTADYYPIKWSLKIGSADAVETANTAALFSALENELNKTNAPGDISSSTCTITWSWPFSGDGVNDGADTILGNIIAGSPTVVETSNSGDTYTTISSTQYSTEVSFGVKLTVTQKD
jgi:hypothetical protein